MAATRFIKTEDIGPWVEALSRTRRTFVPTKSPEGVTLKPYAGQVVCLDKRAATPPKAAVFPQTETLMTFEHRKDAENPGKTRLSVSQNLSESPTLVVGARPCGLRGLSAMDKVFLGGRFKDPYYQARRDKAAFVAVACARPERTCFCNWTGGGPADRTNADVLLTPVAGGYVAEACTAVGEELLAAGNFADAGPKAEEAQAVQAKAEAAMPAKPDFTDLPEKLYRLFEDAAFWEEMAAKCLSCGACTYLCPTCSCFNITDEAAGLQGKRIRTWDTCMSFLYTLEGSGHNPRAAKIQRMRNRVGHKFCYHPQSHGGEIGCAGCGQCVKSCPSALDIRRIVLEALARETEATNG